MTARLPIAEQALTFGLLLGYLVAGASCFSQDSGGKRPRISEEQFLQLFTTGKSISKRTVPAAAISRALAWARASENRGKLDEFSSLTLSECTIRGDLDLSGQSVPLSFVLHDVSISGSALFKNTDFEDTVNVSGVTFNSVAIFEGAKFESSVEFSLDAYQSFTSFGSATFEHESTFDNQTFEHPVTFAGAAFRGMTRLESLSFKDDTEFSIAVFGGPVWFGRVSFGGLASFRGLEIYDSVTFAVASFAKDAFFDELKGRPSTSLQFFGVTFGGRSYFDDSQVPHLRFSTRFSDEDVAQSKKMVDPTPRATTELTRRFYSPTVFEKVAVFRGMHSDVVDFTESEFQDQSDFIGARFGRLAMFRDTTFKGEVNFFGVRFPEAGADILKSIPPGRGLILDGAHFRDRVLLSWGQLVEGTNWWQLGTAARLKLVTSNPTTWYALEEVFRRSANLHGQNEALYERRLLSRDLGSSFDEGVFTNYLSFVFWGYGVRPLRVLFWMAWVFIAFTWIYWTQSPGQGLVRLRGAVSFSIRNSWRLNYGYERAVTTPFRVATLAHSLISKVMGLLLLEALANVSPLLNSVLGKLLPTW